MSEKRKKLLKELDHLDRMMDESIQWDRMIYACSSIAYAVRDLNLAEWLDFHLTDGAASVDVTEEAVTVTWTASRCKGYQPRTIRARLVQHGPGLKLLANVDGPPDLVKVGQFLDWLAELITIKVDATHTHLSDLGCEMGHGHAFSHTSTVDNLIIPVGPEPATEDH